jgi:hypothetical protein
MEKFKRCRRCGREWETRNDFLIDKNLVFTGYQINLLDLTKGLFLFNDNVDGCETTLAVPVQLFSDLYDGKVPSVRKIGQSECEGRCLNEHDLETCQADCECAYIREIMQIIKKYKINQPS